MENLSDAVFKLLPHLMRLKLLILTQNDIAVNSTEKSLHEHLKLLLLLKLFLDVLVAVALLENHLIFL